MNIITEEQVKQHLSVTDCVSVLRDAFARETVNIPRYRLKSANSLLHVMSASIPSVDVMGLKAYGTSRSGASFAVLLYRESTGELLATVQADALGQIRTGAASGLATDLLANENVRVGAIIGTGFQAETQLLALTAVRKFDEIRFYSRSEANRKEFQERMQSRVTCELKEGTSAEYCVRGADVISTITSSKEPVLYGAWLKQGCHINAAGSNWANKTELDANAVQRCDLICVDHLEQSKIESGDLIPVLKDWSSVKELSAVVKGSVKRKDADQITLFESHGIAVEDVAAAYYVYKKLF